MAKAKIKKIKKDTGLSSSDLITSDNTLKLKGKAEPGAKIVIYDNGVKIGTAKANKKGVWSFKTDALDDGKHNFKIKAKKNGKSKTSKKKKTVVDTEIDDPIIAAVADDTGIADGITADNTLTLSGVTEAGAKVKVFLGGDLIGTVYADDDGDWTFTTDALSDGDHSFKVKAKDVAGNKSSKSAATVVTVDTSVDAPSVTGFSDDTGVSGDDITADDTLTITGTAEAGATVEIFDGASSLGTAVADGSGDWSFDTATLTEGAHSFTAVATDVAGNTSAASGPLAVTIDTIAPSAPTIGLATASDDGTTGDGLTSEQVLTLLGTAEAGATVEISYDGTPLATVVADGSGDWSYDIVVPLAYDTHAFTATATDAAGNTSSAAAVDVTVGPSTVYDLTFLGPGFGFIVQGDAGYDLAGTSVSLAGDVNGDGFDDLIVGAPYGNDGGGYAGEAYVVFGSGSGFGSDVGGRQVIDLTSLAAAEGFIIQGDAGADFAGWSVSSAGDVNGDGFDDLIVGAPYGDDGGGAAGEAYVLLGGAFGGSTTPVITSGTAAAEMLIGGAGDDELSGGGGADVIRSGAGDDALTVADQTFMKIDGGSGTDRLAFAGIGETIDFSL
ncbi:MAG: hypothetical protein GY791_19845, partial [Alphaproteobacteria bacterium]|nr:hypothetical protein [Alphaproteobacteria bacterium]